MSETPHDPLAGDPETYDVGDLRVDVGQQRVSRAGADVTLPNLSFQLLVALIRAAPNVLSHDALMERVWPGLVVSPETLNKRATLLREALGDDVKDPRYVAAVRSRGYRLVAAVTRVDPSRDAAAPDVPPLSAIPARKHWLVPAVFTIAALVTAFVAAEWVEHRSSRVPTVAQAFERVDVATRTRLHTVAVLPFENISPVASDAYLARGIPEMVLNRLSRVAGLTVIARSSSFALVTGQIDSQEIGRRLNAGYLVSGSVQRTGERLRVTAQLVDASAETMAWSAHFDRALSDIFTVEDEIGDQVADALSARLGGLPPPTVARERSGNVEAYLAYLRGRALLGRFTVAESEAAVPYFEKAISLDPAFAAAYASLYDSHLQAAAQRHEELAQPRRRYHALIDRALTIDPNCGSAYFARAMWSDAPLDVRDADFLRGAALDPSNGRGLTAYAEFLDWEVTRPEDGARILQRALQIDPMSPRAHFHAAMVGLDQGGSATVEQNMLGVLELDPDFAPALTQVGKYRWLFHDKLAESVQILEHAIALDPRNPLPRHVAMAVYLDLADPEAARAVAAGTPESARAATMRSMYVGDWRAAGRAAYQDIRWSDDCGNWLEPEALRDYALNTGDPGPAIAFIKANYYLRDGSASNLDECNYGPAIVLSQLLEEQGQVEEARKLRHAAMTWNDANAAKFSGWTLRIRAEALLMEGQKDAALAALTQDFAAGDYRHWWYTLKFDPLWRPLHGDPRFQAIARDAERHVDAERATLDALRHQGAIPRRPGST